MKKCKHKKWKTKLQVMEEKLYIQCRRCGLIRDCRTGQDVDFVTFKQPTIDKEHKKGFFEKLFAWIKALFNNEVNYV